MINAKKFEDWGQAGTSRAVGWAIFIGVTAGLFVALVTYDGTLNYLRVVAFWGVVIGGFGSCFRAIAHGRQNGYKSVDYLGKLMAIVAFFFAVVALVPQVLNADRNVFIPLGILFVVLAVGWTVYQLPTVTKRLADWKTKRNEKKAAAPAATGSGGGTGATGTVSE